MTRAEALSLVDRLRDWLTAEFPDLNVSTEIHQPDQTIRHWYQDWRTVIPPAVRGVYLICQKEDDKVVYIGKAHRSSVGGRLRQHFQAVNLDGDVVSFPKAHLFRALPSEAEDLRAAILHGRLTVTAIHIEPREMASMFEAFLHAMAAHVGSLPVLNRRIG